MNKLFFRLWLAGLAAAMAFIMNNPVLAAGNDPTKLLALYYHADW